MRYRTKYSELVFARVTPRQRRQVELLAQAEERTVADWVRWTIERAWGMAPASVKARLEEASDAAL